MVDWVACEAMDFLLLSYNQTIYNNGKEMVVVVDHPCHQNRDPSCEEYCHQWMMMAFG